MRLIEIILLYVRNVFSCLGRYNISETLLPSSVIEQIRKNEYTPVAGSVTPSSVVMQATMTLPLLKGPAPGKHHLQKYEMRVGRLFWVVDITLSFPNRFCQVLGDQIFQPALNMVELIKKVANAGVNMLQSSS